MGDRRGRGELAGPVGDGLQPVAGPWFRAAAVACLVAVLPARRGTANAVRWADLGLSLAFVALLGGAVPLPELGLLALVTGLASLAVFVWFLVLLFKAGRDDAAAPWRPADRA